ncbi:MAG: site-2 protease family protein [Clostridia bacterium]|nr:site-2 protease family protein [Clostridia bacterium]
MIGRVRVKISFMFFAALTLLFVADSGGLAIITLFCAALHEMGHIIAMVCLGDAPDEIAFGIFGIRIQQNKSMPSVLGQVVIVACGPLVNIVLLIVSLVMNSAIESRFLLMLSAVNLVMAAFNLLPILPLDGGRLLVLLLGSLFIEVTVQKIMRIVCAVLLLALILSGVLLVIKTGVNFSLVVTGAYLCVLCIKSIRIRY